jgi:hypothetical protein
MIYIVAATIVLLLLWANEEFDWLKLRKGVKKWSLMKVLINGL